MWFGSGGKREETRTQKPGGRREIARKFFNLQGLLKGTFGFYRQNMQRSSLEKVKEEKSVTPLAVTATTRHAHEYW